MRSATAPAALLWVAACSAGPSAEHAAEPPRTEASAAAPAEARPPLTYEVHEWGMLDVDARSRGGVASHAALVAGPGCAPGAVPAASPPAGHVRRGKPVLYFHVRGDGELTLRVSVDLRPGAPIEHWPAGEVNGSIVRWPSVRLSSRTCEGGPYPEASDPRCASRPGDCELAELGGYTAEGAGCVTVAGTPSNFLFYRGDGPAPALPLGLERRGETVRVTNDGLASPVGEIFWLSRRPGAIFVTSAAMPSPGQSLEFAGPTAPATEAHRAAIRATLATLGLTESEAAAFERAWFADLFDRAAPTPHEFEEALFFFLPPASADAFAHVDAEPPPAAVRRAMAVRARI